MRRPECECGRFMRRIYTRRGAQGKKHHPEGWGCPECEVVIYEKRTMPKV
jgi:hypothetical protein